MKIQFNVRDASVHFQVGVPGQYQKFDVPVPAAVGAVIEKLADAFLPATTSLFGSSTRYWVLAQQEDEE